VKAVLREGLLLALIGAALAFAANALSPRGLQLTKNYFPANGGAPDHSVTNRLPHTAAGTTTNSLLEDLARRLQADGLQLADSAQAARLFADPRRVRDLVIFIDARDEQHYEAGHIPGAYHFDRFHPEAYLTNVVQVCLSAEQIIFYCNGGDCDDSEHAAIMLRDSIGLPKEKVFVYGGGMGEWSTNGLPIELGPRNSGQLTNLAQSAASLKVAPPNK
jgi:rhodanese-related sulfurtransferase